jgi:hypothetical protein
MDEKIIDVDKKYMMFLDYDNWDGTLEIMIGESGSNRYERYFKLDKNKAISLKESLEMFIKIMK